jgi:hypothetical protein
MCAFKDRLAPIYIYHETTRKKGLPFYLVLTKHGERLTDETNEVEIYIKTVCESPKGEIRDLGQGDRNKLVYRDGSLAVTSLPYKLDNFKKGTEGFIHPCCGSNKEKGNFSTYRFIFFAIRKRDNRLVGISDYSVPFIIQARSTWSSQQARDSSSNSFFTRSQYIANYVQYQPLQKPDGTSVVSSHFMCKKEDKEESSIMDGQTKDHSLLLKKSHETIPHENSHVYRSRKRTPDGYESSSSMDETRAEDDDLASKEGKGADEVSPSGIVPIAVPSFVERTIVHHARPYQACHVATVKDNPSSLSSVPAASSSSTSSSSLGPAPTASIRPTMGSSFAANVFPKPAGFVPIGNVEFSCTMLMQLADDNDRSTYIVVKDPSGQVSVNINNVLTPVVRTWKQCYEMRKHCSSGYSPRNSISFQSLFHDIELARLRIPPFYRTIPYEAHAQFGLSKAQNTLPSLTLQNSPPYRDFHDLFTFVSENFVNRRALPIPQDPVNRKRNRNGFYLSTNQVQPTNVRTIPPVQSLPSMHTDTSEDSGPPVIVDCAPTSTITAASAAENAPLPSYQKPITEAELMQINRFMFQFITMHFRTHGPRLMEKLVRAQVHSSSRLESLLSTPGTHTHSSFILSSTHHPPSSTNAIDVSSNN